MKVMTPDYRDLRERQSNGSSEREFLYVLRPISVTGPTGYSFYSRLPVTVRVEVQL